ncbi:MAG: VOC family protein [Acidimicrobiales bacterium]
MAKLISVHPVLNVRDVRESARWYAQLGFAPLFADDDNDPKYGGIGRDNVEIHLQWHSAQEWSEGVDGNVYRFLVDDPDALWTEISEHTDLLHDRIVADTEWGTREFGLYDPDGNALFFYRDR